jgi:hypothetical protein
VECPDGGAGGDDRQLHVAEVGLDGGDDLGDDALVELVEQPHPVLR